MACKTLLRQTIGGLAAESLIKQKIYYAAGAVSRTEFFDGGMEQCIYGLMIFQVQRISYMQE